MPTATTETIRSHLEHVQALQDAIRERLLEQGAAIIEAHRGIEQALREALRQGMDRKALLDILATVRPQAEHTVKSFGGALALLEGDAAAVPAIKSQLREEEAFLAWLRSLEGRVSAPLAPFDESRLAPAPDGPTAEGYVSVSEARARARAGKKP